jgi:hypothetical protein
MPRTKRPSAGCRSPVVCICSGSVVPAQPAAGPQNLQRHRPLAIRQAAISAEFCWYYISRSRLKSPSLTVNRQTCRLPSSPSPLAPSWPSAAPHAALCRWCAPRCVRQSLPSSKSPGRSPCTTAWWRLLPPPPAAQLHLFACLCVCE